MKKYLLALLFTGCVFTSFSQEEAVAEEDKGFQKDRLFTGGSISLSLGTGYFLAGANPVFGYSITKWLDAGIVGNYTYISQKDIYYRDDKAKQHLYGGGLFTRVFPVNFLFAQAQFERNYISQRYRTPFSPLETQNFSANSLLVGAGYTSGRNRGGSFFYMSLLFDLMDDPDSPYYDQQNGKIPIVRTGVQIALFQDRK